MSSTPVRVSSPIRRGRSPGPPSSPSSAANANANANAGSANLMARWLPYVQIPKSLGSLLIPRSFSFSSPSSSSATNGSASTSQQRSVLTPTSVLLASSAGHMDPTLLVQTAIKRITSSCRQLLLGVLDLSEVTDEHVSLLYTAVVREFFHTMSVLEANKIDISDLHSFPEDLRASLDDLFESSGGASTAAAAASRPASPELVNPGNHRLSIMSTSEAAQNDAASESVNSLIHHLIRSLQVKHRQFLSKVAAAKSSSQPTTASPTPPVQSPPLSTSSSSYARLFTSPSADASPTSSNTANASPSTLIHKLYLQLDSTVQREKLDPPTPSDSLTLAAIHALFIRRFHSSLPPLPPSACEFPFKVYMQDPSTRTFFELENPAVNGVCDGALLKLVTASPHPSRPASVASSLHASVGNEVASGWGGKAKQHVAAIADMQHDLRVLKADVADAQVAFAHTLASTRDQLHALLLTHPSASSSSAGAGAEAEEAGGPGGIPRTLITTTRPTLTHLTSQLDARTADLWELVEQARLDMLHHASIPARATLDYAASEMEAVMRLAGEMAARIDVAAPAWKSVWERELARVVDEQQALARVEGVLEVSGKSLERIDKVLVQLHRVSALAEERGVDGVLPPRPPVQVGGELDPEDQGDEWASTVQGVLEEIQLVSVDHERRMKAVERTEKVRQWARENQGGAPDTPLAKELVSKARSKSRDTRRREVAIEEVERERERRNREVLRALREVQQVLDHGAEGTASVARTAE